MNTNEELQYPALFYVIHNEMARSNNNLIAFCRDQAGQVTVEWTLLIVAFGIPMIWLFWLMLTTLVEYYRMIVCILSLPFP